MRRQQPGRLPHGFCWSSRDERHGQHGVGKVFCAERDDVEGHSLIGVLLREDVCEGESQGLEEHEGAEEEACGYLV